MTQTEYTNLLAVITGFSARMDKGFADIRKEFIKVREEMTDGFSDVRKEMVSEFGNVRKEMGGGLSEVLNEMASALTDVRKEMASGLSGVRDEMAGGLTGLRKEMRIGFAELYAADQEILHAISEAYDDHESRIVRLESVVAIK